MKYVIMLLCLPVATIYLLVCGLVAWAFFGGDENRNEEDNDDAYQ